MTYLPYILITPLVWTLIHLPLSLVAENDKQKNGAAFAATVLTLALWGFLLLVIN